MNKKEFKSDINPATMFISAGSEQQNTQSNKSAGMPAPKTKKAGHKETKSKRFNLMLYPTLHDDLDKIATMKKDSVNNLINDALISYRNKNKDLIQKYDEVFER